MRRPHGYFYGSADGSSSRPFEADSLMCPHCNAHFMVEPKATPAQLGQFCTNCMAQCCVKPECNAVCVPFMKRIEQQEQRARLRAALVLVLCLLSVPVSAQTYPPDGPPLPSPEMGLRALGWDFDPFPAADVGAPVTVDFNCARLVGAWDFCAAGIARLQQSLNDSQLGHITARLTSIMQSTLVPDGNLATDLARVTNPSDGFGDDILARRNADGADCTVVLTTSSNYCGQAYVLAGATSCIAMVYHGCIDNFSYEHEIGHNAGLAHDQPNSSHGGFASTSYGWCAGCGHKDYMVYPNPCGGDRIARISNVNQFCPFHPTVPFGTSTANGYLAWLNRAPIMAAFRHLTGAVPPTNHPRSAL